MEKIYRTCTVVAKNLENGKVITDKFTASSTAEAIHSFRECYRHSDYEILATITGEDLRKEEREKKIKNLIRNYKQVRDREEEKRRRNEQLYKQWEESEDEGIGAELDLAYEEWQKAREETERQARASLNIIIEEMENDI